MEEVLKNPFLEGSEEVPPEEVEAAARALAEEAKAVRSRAVGVKLRAEKARAEKEAALLAEQQKKQAEIDATRAQIVKTVASISKTSGKSTIRPEAPSAAESNPFAESTSISVDGSGTPSVRANILSLSSDIIVTAIVFMFVFLLYQEIAAH